MNMILKILFQDPHEILIAIIKIENVNTVNLCTYVTWSTVQLYSRTQHNQSSLPLTELCALSLGTLHLSRNLPLPDLAGPVFDPAKDKKKKKEKLVVKLLEGGKEHLNTNKRQMQMITQLIQATCIYFIPFEIKTYTYVVALPSNKLHCWHFLESCLKIVVIYYFNIMDLKINQIRCDISIYKIWNLNLSITAILLIVKCVIVNSKELKTWTLPDWGCHMHVTVMIKVYLLRSLDQSSPLQFRNHPTNKLRVEFHFIHLHLSGLRTKKWSRCTIHSSHDHGFY